MLVVNLESLRRRFEAGANDAGVIVCTLIHWGSDDIPLELQSGHYPLVSFRPELPHSEIDLGYYRGEVVDGGQILLPRNVVYQSRTKDVKASIALFQTLAAEANRCLNEFLLTHELSAVAPSLDRHAESISPAQRWIWFLFDLAWAEPVSSPRYASKSIWAFAKGEDPRIPESIGCFPYSSDEIKRYLEGHGLDRSVFSCLEQWADALPDRYMSIIDDLFATSIWAINKLIDRATSISSVTQQTADPPDLVDESARTVSRRGKTARFGKKERAWQLFCALRSAGSQGKSREELLAEIWTNPVQPNNLDQQKGLLDELLMPLGLEVAADNRGIWRLSELGAS